VAKVAECAGIAVWGLINLEFLRPQLIRKEKKNTDTSKIRVRFSLVFTNIRLD
jgi:hypothetical protein